MAKISLLTTMKKWRQGICDVKGRCWRCNAFGVEPKANDTFEHMFLGYVICPFLPSIKYSKFRTFFFARSKWILSFSVYLRILWHNKYLANRYVSTLISFEKFSYLSKCKYYANESNKLNLRIMGQTHLFSKQFVSR